MIKIYLGLILKSLNFHILFKYQNVIITFNYDFAYKRIFQKYKGKLSKIKQNKNYNWLNTKFEISNQQCLQ